MAATRRCRVPGRGAGRIRGFTTLEIIMVVIVGVIA
jgi:hypothetical protein